MNAKGTKNNLAQIRF